MCWFLYILFCKSPLCGWDKSRNVDVFSFLFPPSDGDQRRYMSVSEWSRRPGEIYQLLANYLQSARADKKEKSRNTHKLCRYHDHLVKLHQFLTFICIEKRFLKDISPHLSLNAATATGQMRFGLRREFCKIIRHILIIEFSPKCTIVPKQQAGIYVSIHLSLEAGLGDNLLASCPILHGQDKRGIRYSISKNTIRDGGSTAL